MTESKDSIYIRSLRDGAIEAIDTLLAEHADCDKSCSRRCDELQTWGSVLDALLDYLEEEVDVMDETPLFYDLIEKLRSY